MIHEKEIDPTGGVKVLNKGELVKNLGLGSFIGKRNLDWNNAKLAPKQLAMAIRIRKWHNRCSNEKRRIQKAIRDLNLLSNKLNLTKTVKEEAKMILRKILEKFSLQGSSFLYLAAASIYVAFKVKKQARSIDYIAKETGIPKDRIAKKFKFIMRNLNLKLDPLDGFLERVCSISVQLKINEQTQLLAQKILSLSGLKNILAGKKPNGWATAALYLACLLTGQNKTTQEELALVANISSVTLRNRYKEIRELVCNLIFKQES